MSSSASAAQQVFLTEKIISEGIMINTKIEDGIIIAAFENGKGNTITLDTVKAIGEIVKKADTDDAIKGIVLTGTGKVMSSGFDLPMFLSLKDLDEVVAFFNIEEPILLDLFRCRKPVIAAINGHAVAAGMIFSMACDYRIMADNPKIKFGMSEIKIGLPLSIVQSGVVRFGLNSDRTFRDVMYFGEMLTPGQAKAIGAVDELVPAEQLIARAKELVCKFIDNPGRAFIKLKEGLKKPAADAIQARLDKNDFDPQVRSALEFVMKMMG
jgi:enoyl-CoA hydratase/carnithine racemase